MLHKLLRILLISVYAAFTATLFFSVTAFYKIPSQHWLTALSGMGFPYLICIQIAFIPLLMLIRKRLAFIPMLAIVFCWKFLSITFSFNASDSTKGDVKIMTWNINSFDLYNWRANAKSRAKMMDIIRSEKPDIICLQEFYTDNNYLYNNIRYLKDSLGFTHYVFYEKDRVEKPKTKKKNIVRRWGTAIFSKHPVESSGEIEFPNSKSNGCNYADIRIDNKSVRVYSAHLESIKLGFDENRYLSEIERRPVIDWYYIAQIVRSIKSVYAMRSEQVNLILTSVYDKEGSAIIAGDFNDVPVSFTYNTLSKQLTDSFTKQKFGLGATYANRLFPFRIDYVWGRNVVFHSSSVLRGKRLSDHYPIVVTFSLPN